jgi:hypothetical protein
VKARTPASGPGTLSSGIASASAAATERPDQLVLEAEASSEDLQDCCVAGALDEDVRQRVSRCSWWVRQRGQNFFISMRSGSLRRFFLVM